MGYVILGVTVVNLAVIIAAASRSIARGRLKLLILISFVPLVLGLLGTAIGYESVRNAFADEPALDPEIIRIGRQAARITSYLGGGCSLFLLAVTGTTAMRRRQQADPL